MTAADGPAVVDVEAAARWIRARVGPVGEIVVAHERPWATVMRVPLAGGIAWFKACANVQRFEPRLSAALYQRWPDRVGEVLAFDEERAWLLLRDAGTAIGHLGNPPETWLELLPRYAELQRVEASHADDHVADGVPDLRLRTLAERYGDLLRPDLPLGAGERAAFGAFERRFRELCDEVALAGVPDTVQHGDLHLANVYRLGDRLRVLDWGDASISHPFASLVETFRFLEEENGLDPADPWFARLRDAYLEPWGRGLIVAFGAGFRLGTFAHAIAWVRQRDALPASERAEFDVAFRIILRRALALACRDRA